VRNSISRIT